MSARSIRTSTSTSSSTLTSEAKEALRKHVRALRVRLLAELSDAARSEYRLDVAIEKAKLPEARRCRRERLEDWIKEQARTSTRAHTNGGGATGEKTGKKSAPRKDAAPASSDVRARFFRDAVKEAAHTLVNRLVFVRILEHHGVLAPAVLTGGWSSAAYAQEFVHYAGPLGQQETDDTRGYRALLCTVFDELALELPGLFGPVGLTALFPIPAATLRDVVNALNDAALDSAWGDDTTLGWVYQYWNDPEREALDDKIAGGGKIEPHEIAQKTQMFTERYMVEWLLQNSLGLTWLSLCKKNGWTPDADAVLPVLDARRAEFRGKRERGEVALDALMPIEGGAEGIESAWKYYVPQPIPLPNEKAPHSIREVKLLDPACGSGHFLVIAFGLFARMYEEEARHRGEAWSREAIAESILANNLHGIDIDARAIQIAAAGLWLKAKLYAPQAKLARMNLVAPCFRLASLPNDDPALAHLFDALSALGIPKATTKTLVESLRGVDHLGTLLRVDRAIAALVDDAEKEDGPLFGQLVKHKRAELEARVTEFLDAHAAEADLGLRLEGEQLAAGLRFVQMVKEGRYDVVVGNPPYQGLSKTAQFDYVVKHYPRGKADLYAAFLERAIELCREGGLSALLTMRGWMFLGQFAGIRKQVLGDFDLRNIGDFDRGAFDEVPNEVLAVAAPIIRRTPPANMPSVAIQPTPFDDKSYDRQRTNRKRAAVLAQVGRYEFDPKGFEVIEGEPIVYWWTTDFLARYAAAPKLGRVSPARFGLTTGDNERFVRFWFEPAPCAPPSWDEPLAKLRARMWVPFVLGGKGRLWFEPLRDLCRWFANGLEVKEKCVSQYGTVSKQVRNESAYFSRGVAFAMIGANFSARAHCFPSVIGNMGSSVYPSVESLASTVAFMNREQARFVLSSLNPGVHFEVGDVNRLPIFGVSNAEDILASLHAAFDAHEAHREGSAQFIRPGPSCWRYSQDWAQRAVDRPAATPLPPYEPSYDLPPAEAHVSFALGVALGRFGANADGILETAPPDALPAGVLFVGPSDTLTDSLAHPAAARIGAAWDEQQEAILGDGNKKTPLRDWLRKDFFAHHKGVYENRPIYFPLSSEKKSFVAWTSIHRWTDSTLQTLLADHVNPVLRQLDGEIADLNAARASLDKKAAGAAEKRYATVKRLRDELANFASTIGKCAERGPDDESVTRDKVDAPFRMDLDDGVMINSAALWPLLQPQWADPKKWWKQLCLADGRKDYDWSHLAARYFPTRVDAKCKVDPSLAVAHHCFWKYHPAKALAWELRLQDEIRPDFTIDEPDSAAARTTFLRDHAAEAETMRQKEIVRRDRRAAKAESGDELTEDDATDPISADEG